MLLEMLLFLAATRASQSENFDLVSLKGYMQFSKLQLYLLSKFWIVLDVNQYRFGSLWC